MAEMTDYLANRVLDYIAGDEPMNRPAYLYVGLLTGPASDDGNYTEPNSTDYHRVQVPNTAAAWPAASARLKSNGVLVDMGTIATEAYPYPATHWALFDALTGGNILISGVLAVPYAGGLGDSFDFPVGTLPISAPTE